MKILQKILVVFIAGGITLLFIFASFSFSWEKNDINTPSAQKSEATLKNIQIQKAAILTQSWWTKSYIKYSPVQDISKATLSKTESFYIDFWRLSSVFFLPSTASWTNSLSSFVLDGKYMNLSTSGSMIVSLYDPFTLYSFGIKSKNFVIDQITNGSIYIGNESDGTVSIYSIDTVWNLVFLGNKGEKVSEMTLFPWMYIRFHPKQALSLDHADLFKIIQVIQNPDPDMGITGIEFVDPRINIGKWVDAFFMYRLPPSTRILFRQLRLVFEERVEQVDMLKSYANSGSGGFLSSDDVSPFLINPWKKNAILLQDLQNTFSEWLKQGADTKRIIDRVWNIYTTAKTLPIGNDVDILFQSFITDGRFALFSPNTPTTFLDIYNQIARIAWVAPTTEKYLIFQKIADIYSRNLISQIEWSSVDVYGMSSKEILWTLTASWVSPNEYFNVAVYSSNILNKAQDQGFFNSGQLLNTATYNLIYSLFITSDTYIQNIQSSVDKDSVYKSIASALYVPILESLVNSLYKNFVRIEDTSIVLDTYFFPDGKHGKMRVDAGFVSNLNKIDGILSRVSDWEYPFAETDALRIKVAYKRLHAFILLLDDSAYSDYLKNPYIATMVDGIAFPSFAPDYSRVVHKNDSVDQGEPIVQNSSGTTSETTLSRIQKILWNVPQENITREADGGFRIQPTNMRIDSKETQTPYYFTFSAYIDAGIAQISQIEIIYSGHKIHFADAPYAVDGFMSRFTTDWYRYLEKIQSFFSQNQIPETKSIIFLSENRITIGSYNLSF